MPEPAKTKFTCGCREVYRSACQNQPFFKNYEGKDYCVLHYPGTDKRQKFHAALSKKLAEQDFDFRGICFPEFAEFINARFNAEVDFRGASFNEGASFMGASFGETAYFNRTSFNAVAEFDNANFRAEAYFSDTNFRFGAEFADVNFRAKADFSRTTFEAGANFSRTSFSAAATFGKANFGAEATFLSASFSAAADFNFASFNATAYFGHASFSLAAHFNRASFNADANFSKASFSADAEFNSAIFKDYVRFSSSSEGKALGEKPCLDFQFARFEKPERASFHSLSLHPHWFINVDARKFEFVDVDWDYRLKDELASAGEAKVSAPHRLMAITFRQLADNAEANHRYYEASRFRFNAFEARRIEKSQGFVLWLRDWWQWLASSFKPWQLDWWYWRARGFKPWRLDWWYWLASGYGESVGRAFCVFVLLLFLFTCGYTQVGFEPSSKNAIAVSPSTATTLLQPDTVGKTLEWKDAMVYSLNVSILQKPEPKPLTRWAKLLVALETILGSAQAALLALAVRRRFMR